MIIVKRDYPVSSKFWALVEYFNALEKKLQYPSCEGHEDEKRILQEAEKALIIWGKL